MGKMLNKELEQMYQKNSEYSQIIDNILGYKNKQYKNDLLQEISLYYLENEKKIEEVIKKGYFKYYFIITIKQQVNSSTSSFYKNVRMLDKFCSENVQDVIDEYGLEYKQQAEEKWEVSNCLRKKTKMTYFESEMMRLYFDENMTYRAIADDYEINHTLVFKTIKDVLERMKKQLDKN